MQIQLGSESRHINDTRGALFKITPWSHGYTFVAKDVPSKFVQVLGHEESIFSILTLLLALGSLIFAGPFRTME